MAGSVLPLCDVAAASFVTAELDGIPTLCLKAERIGKDHVNHYLVALDPLHGQANMALRYADPEMAVQPTEPGRFVFTGQRSGLRPQIGDIFTSPFGAYLKLRDAPHAQKLFAYVDIATGLIRPRMERHVEAVLLWRLDR